VAVDDGRDHGQRHDDGEERRPGAHPTQHGHTLADPPGEHREVTGPASPVLAGDRHVDDEQAERGVADDLADADGPRPGDVGVARGVVRQRRAREDEPDRGSQPARATACRPPVR
jgi:hypothetical protein